MELELINILSDLYIKYGNTDEVIKLSKIIDVFIVNKQRIKLKNHLDSSNIS